MYFVTSPWSFGLRQAKFVVIIIIIIIKRTAPFPVDVNIDISYLIVSPWLISILFDISQC